MYKQRKGNNYVQEDCLIDKLSLCLLILFELFFSQDCLIGKLCTHPVGLELMTSPSTQHSQGKEEQVELQLVGILFTRFQFQMRLYLYEKLIVKKPT